MLALIASAASAQTTGGARGSSAAPSAARSTAPSPAPSAATRPATPSAPVTSIPAGSSGSGSRTRTPVTGVTPSTGSSSLLPPMQQAPQVAPPSQQLPTQFSTGGTTQSNLALSPGASGTSSSTTPSAPGGGGKTLKDCMGFGRPRRTLEIGMEGRLPAHHGPHSQPLRCAAGARRRRLFAIVAAWRSRLRPNSKND